MKRFAVKGDMRDKVVTALKKSPWFGGLKDQEIEGLVEIAKLGKYDAGEVIVRAGDASDSIFLLMKGRVTFEIAKDSGESLQLGRATPPFTFGEVGLLLNKERTASVVAEEESFALAFDADQFAKLFDEIPGFRLSLARGLAKRLEDVSELVLPQHTKADGLPSEDVFTLLPLSFIQRHRVLPLGIEDNLLTIGFVEDPTPQAIAGVRHQLPGMELQAVRVSAQLFEEILTTSAGFKQEVAKEAAGKQEHPRPAVELPVKLLHLLQRMVAEGASDLHLVAERKPVWRIDGDMIVIEDVEPLGRTEVRDLVDPLLEQRLRQEFAQESDVDFAMSAEGVGRFRVNLYWTNRGVNAAFRLIPWKVLSLDQLGVPPVLKSFCQQPKGLVLVTGPTGSGKSTTLAGMVDFINRMRKCHIITIEDPIEFVHQEDQSVISQREIGHHVKSFQRGLRAALREDPDVVLLGELREPETAFLALEMANTGHLVLATVHTNSAVSTIERLVDMFPPQMQAAARSNLADCLRGIVSQTLCKGRAGGRVAAIEVLVGSVATANLIREDKSSQLPNVMQVGGKEGNRLLNDDLARLVKDRKVLYEEAQSKAVDKKDLARRLGKIPAPDPTRKKSPRE